MTLEVKNGCFTYSSAERKVLNDISLCLNDKDVLAILGPNGAGKTTLLRCIMGILKWNSGMTFINDKPISNISSRELWQQISYVPQAREVPASYRVEEMIMLGRASMINPLKTPGIEDAEAVNQAIDKTGLNGIRNRFCNSLSGGEYQMVLIARAIVSKPKILVLDEPESNLDYQNQLMVLNLITKLAQEGVICIFNTHYPAHALRRGTKTLMLSKDGSYDFGNVRDVITEHSILKYFGVRSVISEFETEDSSYSDVVPVAIDTGNEKSISSTDSVIAGVTVIFEKLDSVDEFNAILHEYNNDLISRMGLPYHKAGVNIITLMMDAPLTHVLELKDKISRLSGAHVKTNYIARNSCR